MLVVTGTGGTVCTNGAAVGANVVASGGVVLVVQVQLLLIIWSIVQLQVLGEPERA